MNFRKNCNQISQCVYRLPIYSLSFFNSSTFEMAPRLSLVPGSLFTRNLMTTSEMSFAEPRTQTYPEVQWKTLYNSPFIVSQKVN